MRLLAVVHGVFRGVHMESQADAVMPATGFTHHGHGLTEWLVLALLVALWGSAFAALSISVATIHPVWVVALRSWAAVLVIFIAAPAMLARGQGRAAEACNLKAIGWFVLIGLAFTTLPVLVFAEASRTEPSAVLAICNGASPVFTALLAHQILAGERMSLRRGIGVALGFAGLLVLLAPDLLAGKPVHTMVLAGAIGATLLYAAGNIATRMAPHISAGASSLIITGSGAVVMTVAALFTAPWPSDASWSSWVAVILLGAGPSGLATLAYVWLIRRSGPMFVSFATYMSPVWAMGIGVIFLQEKLEWSMAAALVLILAGVAVAHARRSKAASLS